MAAYYENIIQLKTFLLTAWGEAPFKPGRSKILVLNLEPELNDKNINAHGFDIGSIRQSLETHAEAEALLEKFQTDKLQINQFRKIDPQQIQIREMVYEVRAIDLDDSENEILTVIGALDSMNSEEAAVIKATYPKLVDTKIEKPAFPKYETWNGDEPKLSFSCVKGCSSQQRAIFNEVAENLSLGEALPTPAGYSLARTVNSLFSDFRYFKTFDGLTEEIGKARMGIKNLGNHDEILEMRLYDYRETYKPEVLPVSAPANALDILSKQDPAVARTLLDAMAARRINPFPG